MTRWSRSANEFPDARVVVLTTFEGDAGKKTVPREVGARLVDQLREDPLTPREIAFCQSVN